MKEKLEILKHYSGQWSSNKTIFSEEKPKVLATKMSEKKDFSSNFMNTEKVMGLFSPHKTSQLLQLSNKYPNTYFDRDS